MKKACHMTSAHSLTDIRIFHKECKTLLHAGYDVTLVVQHDRDEVVDGINIKGLEKPRNRRERMIKTVKQLYDRALECDADIYHFHDPELISIGLKLKRKGKKVIYDVHEDVPRQILSKEWVPASLRSMISWVVERMENFAAKRFDYIVTATPFIRERFLKINRFTLDINNYPILCELYEPNEDWSHKEQLVCYVGGIETVRGINEMVEAISLTQYFLLLAGKFESKHEMDTVVCKDGWKQVIEMGHVNRNGVKIILSRSMAGLVILHPVPNYINALPIKMFEYMAAGIPVIASDFPLWVQIIEDNKCGICVDPLNIAEISDAINWILEHPAESQKMGENGRRLIEEEFNWEEQGSKLLKIYEGLLII
ncbi:MAG: glycosyltransferase family 4 protein [Syntrophomonadaceae bacterium]|nr:glycosyltransferase family 4 protein [Syntrophomonadaceae bacterium]